MAVDEAFSSQLGHSVCHRDEQALLFIEETTRDAERVQQNVLTEILTQNSGVEYLARFGVTGVADLDSFKTRVPVVTYEDILPDIQRIANGDVSPILSSIPISEFLTSSGTSAGERKLMPSIEDELDRRQLLYSLLMPVMNLYVPGLDKGKGLYFLFVKSESMTAGGLPARPVLTSYYKSDHFKMRPYDPYNVITSPIEAILCTDVFQSMYIQMLCGLLEAEHVLRVGAVFASGLLRAIRFLQLHWEEMSSDIETGTLSDKITDPSLRYSVADMLKPDPARAKWITTECGKHDWNEIITRIWPNTRYVEVIVTGAMAQYIPTLDYYSGGLPLACTMYASSECYFGLNLNPLCRPFEVSYTILPTMGYFEFLPQEPDSLEPTADPIPNLIDLVDVEVGKEYELVITTYAGLYRYRVGDILRVTGFHNSAPQFQFLRRKNVLLSIDTDKTDESELQKAVENASRLLQEFNTAVVEYTSYADIKMIPGHYVIYWELLAKDSFLSPSDDVMGKCCLAMENSLNSAYRQGRVADGSIGPLEIRVVENGTFEELMDYAISRGASINQYKAPRCVSFNPILELLDSRVIATYFSPSLPRWNSILKRR